MTGASGDIKRKILKTLREGPMSISELSRRLKMRRDFITGYLEALRNNGEVKVVKVGRSKVYRPEKGKR
jgi:DNA-binding transcriptional ArsR family regulator